MPDYLFYIVALVLVVLGITAYKIPVREWIPYFKTRTGLGILKGIVICIALGVALALFSGVAKADKLEYFEFGEMFMGLDYTKKSSPMCEQGGVDDQWTSNLGLRFNVVNYGNAQVNAKATHHSCMLGVDDRSYDALGVELVWRFW